MFKMKKNHVLQRWAWIYRKDSLMFIINSNNGLERQNKVFKYQYLQCSTQLSLTSMITKLVKEYLPDKLKKYKEQNIFSSNEYRAYNQVIPAFLVNRPKAFVQHCMERIRKSTYATSNHITVVSSNPVSHYVMSENIQGKKYKIELHNDTMPSCTCQDFTLHKWPCKHVCCHDTERDYIAESTRVF